MAIIIGKRTNLDAPIKVESLNGVMFTTEAEAHQFVVRCEQKGQELTLAGTISAKFARADGNTVQLVGSISDGAAVVTLAQDCYNVQGRFQLAIFNTVGDTKLCIYACVGTVQRAQSGNLIDGGGIIPDVEDLIADIQAAVQSIPPTYDALLASIAGTYSATKTYAVGDYVWYDGSLYRCTTAITTAESWTSGHWTAAVLGDDLSVIKSALQDIENDLYDNESVDVTPDTYTDNYYIDARSDYLGTVQYGTTWKVTGYISCEGYEQVNLDAAITLNGRAGIVFFDNTNQALSGIVFPAPDGSNTHEEKTYDIPANATKMRISVFKAFAESFYVKTIKSESKVETLNNAIEVLGTYVETNVSSLTERVNSTEAMLSPVYMVDRPRKPLLAEMMADFAWCSMITPAAFTGKNVVLTVSGSENSNQLTASAITPDGLSISDVGTKWVGGVISADGVNFSVCNFKYVSGSTIEIYPALTENISNGSLSTLMYDSGASYVGLHLTENGYKAYMQNLYAKNPKHSEVGKYIARFRPETDNTSPFTWYGGTIPAEQYRFITVNKKLVWLQHPTSKFYGYQYSTSWAAHTTKSGAYWEVDLKGKSGYLEAYIFAICSALELPTDQELHIVVTIDGVEQLNKVVSDSICRRIVVDYENATTGRLEVYSNKWYKVDNNPYGFGFGRVTWWVNELDYPDAILFPKGAVIAQEFDSWGVFHNGVSGVEMERLHNAVTGVSVPYTNHSKGDQTSAWGKAWFYENVWKYNPSICIHDFVINDTNSMDNAGIPATIEGPDEVEYDNKLTSAEYAANMILLGKLAMSNGIQPIFMSACQHGSTNYYTFTNALIDAMSSSV